MATGPGAEQIQLRLLDPILSLTPLTVETVVEVGRFSFKIGHDEARIVALATEFEAGDHPPRTIPTVGGIAEFPDPALFAAALGVGLFHQSLPPFDLAMQTGVAGQADHVADLPALAPANQALATEARVAPDDDPHRRPGLAEPSDQELDDGRRMPGAIDPAAAQHAGQHGLAAEDVEGQVAVAVVVGVELLCS